MGRACRRFMGVMSLVPGLSAARGGSLGSPGCAFEAVTRVLKVFNPKPEILGCDMLWKRIWDADWHCRIFNPETLDSWEKLCLMYEINCDQMSCGELETGINLKGRTGPLLGWC